VLCCRQARRGGKGVGSRSEILTLHHVEPPRLLVARKWSHVWVLLGSLQTAVRNVIVREPLRDSLGTVIWNNHMTHGQ